MDINVCTIVGRLAGDPVLKSYKKGDGTEGFRCFMRVAVTRLMDRGQKDREKRRTNFVPVVAWGEAAKRHAQFLAKGTQVTVTGELIAESQRQQDGSYREFIHLQANDVQYGQRPLKSATPEQAQRQLDAAQRRIEEIAAGSASAAPASTSASAPATPEGTPFGGSDGDNPFAAPAGASA